MFHGAEFADTQSMRANDKLFRWIYNESDLWKDSCD